MHGRSLTYAVESSQYASGVSLHKDHKIVKVPNSQRLKIMATYASAKLARLQALGCGGLTT